MFEIWKRKYLYKNKTVHEIRAEAVNLLRNSTLTPTGYKEIIESLLVEFRPDYHLCKFPKRKEKVKDGTDTVTMNTDGEEI